MIQRINALFRANGECKVQLAHLTGAADTVPGKAVSGPGKPPLTQVETAVARYETCQLGMECENDIYDGTSMSPSQLITVKLPRTPLAGASIPWFCHLLTRCMNALFDYCHWCSATGRLRR